MKELKPKKDNAETLRTQRSAETWEARVRTRGNIGVTWSSGRLEEKRWEWRGLTAWRVSR
jgi:hypothetical protein